MKGTRDQRWKCIDPFVFDQLLRRAGFHQYYSTFKQHTCIYTHSFVSQSQNMVGFCMFYRQLAIMVIDSILCVHQQRPLKDPQSTHDNSAYCLVCRAAFQRCECVKLNIHIFTTHRALNTSDCEPGEGTEWFGIESCDTSG